jgi:hypothetical protein
VINGYSANNVRISPYAKYPSAARMYADYLYPHVYGAGQLHAAISLKLVIWFDYCYYVMSARRTPAGTRSYSGRRLYLFQYARAHVIVWFDWNIKYGYGLNAVFLKGLNAENAVWKMQCGKCLIDHILNTAAFAELQSAVLIKCGMFRSHFPHLTPWEILHLTRTH